MRKRHWQMECALLACMQLTAALAYAQDEGAEDSHLAAAAARSNPAWLQPGLIYEVFVHDFSPAGDFNGVTAALDRLKTLGVTVVWLMPIHPPGQLKKAGPLGSPYAVRDFYAIDPSFGSKDDLRHLVDEAHRRGMKVILDMVFDHTSFDSVMMAHPDFYKHDKNGQLISPHGWNDVAALDYTNPALRQYIVDVLLYWAKEFKVDGYRCDAAGELPTSFWEQARAALDQQNPNLLMLAEAAKPELAHTAFSLDYDWPLLFKLDDVMMKGAPVSDLQAVIERTRMRFPKGATHMLISDDHDTDRAINRYGAPAALAASALMFTLEGVPLLYNGMEVGDAGPSAGPALFETLKIYWPSSQIHPEFAKFYRFMIPFRASHPALWKGTLTWVHNSDEQHVVSYLRQSANEQILAVINLSDTPFRGTVEAGPFSWVESGSLFVTSGEGHAALPAVSLDAYQFASSSASRSRIHIHYPCMRLRSSLLLVVASFLWGSGWMLAPSLAAVATPYSAGALLFAAAALALFPAWLPTHPENAIPARLTLRLAFMLLALPTALLTFAGRHGASGLVPLLYSALPLAVSLPGEGWSPGRSPAMLVAVGATLVLLNGHVPFTASKLPLAVTVLAAVVLQAFALRYAAAHLAGSPLLALLRSLALQCALSAALLAALSLLCDPAPRLAPPAQWTVIPAVSLVLLAALAAALPYALLLLLLAQAQLRPEQIAVTQWLQFLFAIFEGAAFGPSRPPPLLLGSACVLLACCVVVLHTPAGETPLSLRDTGPCERS